MIGVRGTYGIELEGNVVILDEAQCVSPLANHYCDSHGLCAFLPFASSRSNIEDACRNAASVEVSYTDIKGATHCHLQASASGNDNARILWLSDTAAVLASIIQGTKNEEALENHRLVYKVSTLQYSAEQAN
jgi:hypothetical protein